MSSFPCQQEGMEGRTAQFCCDVDRYTSYTKGQDSTYLSRFPTLPFLRLLLFL